MNNNDLIKHLSSCYTFDCTRIDTNIDVMINQEKCTLRETITRWMYIYTIRSKTNNECKLNKYTQTSKIIVKR